MRAEDAARALPEAADDQPMHPDSRTSTGPADELSLKSGPV